MTTFFLTAIIALFVAYELVAKWVYRDGKVKTLSYVVRRWEGGRRVRLVVVSGLLVVLWVHLVARWF